MRNTAIPANRGEIEVKRKVPKYLLRIHLRRYPTVVLCAIALLHLSIGANAARLDRFPAERIQVNLIENGNFNRAVGGLPVAWEFEGEGKSFLLNKGMYHGVSVEATNRTSEKAVLVSTAIPLAEDGQYVLTGFITGGTDAEKHAIVATDRDKKGGGVVEARCHDEDGNLVGFGTQFTFRGTKRIAGSKRFYASPDCDFGYIFRRFSLPQGTKSVRVALGLRTATGTIVADNLGFYRDLTSDRPSLAIKAYSLLHRGGWTEKGVLNDGVRDPGPEGEINPVICGVHKYRNNAYLVTHAPKGVDFDLGEISFIEGLEISQTAQMRDVVDLREERFPPRAIQLSFSPDGKSYGDPVELEFQPALMQSKAFFTSTWQGFSRLARFVRVVGAPTLTEVRFFGGNKEDMALAYRPKLALKDGQIVYGVEVSLCAIDDRSFMERVPKGNIHRIARNRYADLAFLVAGRRIPGRVIFGDFEAGRIMRRTLFAPEAAVLAREGASLEIAYHDKIEVWDSPTTHAHKVDQKRPPRTLRNALPPVPRLVELNEALSEFKAELKGLAGPERQRLSAITSARLTPDLLAIGLPETEVAQLFAEAGKARTLGPELLPKTEARSEEGSVRYQIAFKDKDILLIERHDAKTGRFLTPSYHGGHYLGSGDLPVVWLNTRLSQRRDVKDDETFEQAYESDAEWRGCGRSMQLERGFRAVFKIPFDLPEAGTWVMCYKTLWQFPESAMLLNGNKLDTPFRWNQHQVVLRDCRKGRNEIAIFADASKAKINLEMKPYRTAFYHLFWCRAEKPLVGAGRMVMLPEGTSGKATLVSDHKRCVLDLPDLRQVQPAAIQFRDLLQPTSTTGIITNRASDGDYVDKDGNRFPVWGGHWNHVHSKKGIELACRMLPAMGVHAIRNIYGSESELTQSVGKWRPDALDKVFYQVYRFGQAGIHLCPCLHSYGWYRGPEGDLCGIESGTEPRGRPYSRLWHPVFIRALKNYAAELLTTVNPYTGQKLVDDPTMIAIEIGNECFGLGGRGFDYNELVEPERTIVRKHWNNWLLRKYRNRDKLNEAWTLEPLTEKEDPRKGNIPFPPQFKSVRWSPNFFHNWDAESRTASPRVSDALEWCQEVVGTFLKTMHDHLRALGVKCPISWCGFSTYEIQMTNLHPYLMVCDSLGGSAYGARNNFRSLERWYYLGSFNSFFGKSTHVREWSSWNTGSDVAYSSNGLLTAGLFGLAHGFDHWSHHKLGSGDYPSQDQEALQNINPDTDHRRAVFSFVAWAHKRAKIPVERPRLLIGIPKAESCYGGLNSPCDTQPLKGGYTFLYDQAYLAYHVFDEVYDGPQDIVVMHEGRSPSGDYRQAQHAILWAHGKTDRTGRNQKERDEWFARHGVTFRPGERWQKTDRVLAFNCDLTDDPELNEVMYDTLVEWGVTLPFGKDEIKEVYATLDRSIEVDTRLARMKVDRDDFQAWMGQNHGAETKTSRLSIVSAAGQVQVISLPFDTASFKTSRKITLWSRTDATVTLKATFDKEPEVWAINWVGVRKQRVFPLAWDEASVTIPYKHDLDVHFYEVLR